MGLNHVKRQNEGKNDTNDSNKRPGYFSNSECGSLNGMINWTSLNIRIHYEEKTPSSDNVIINHISVSSLCTMKMAMMARHSLLVPLLQALHDCSGQEDLEHKSLFPVSTR